MALNKAFKQLNLMTKEDCTLNNWHIESDQDMKPYLMQGEYTVEYVKDGTWKTTCKNKNVEKYGLDRTFLRVLQRTFSEIKRVVGYTRANLTSDDGEIHSYNAHPFYHDGPWYDWAYVYYEIDDDGESKSYHYPS